MKRSKCGTEFEGNFCPNCSTPAQGTTPVANPAIKYAAKGTAPKKKFKWWYILIAVVALGVIGALFGGGDKTPAAPSQSAVHVSPSASEPAKSSPKVDVQTPEVSTAPVETTSTETMGEKNALKSAKNYLSFSAFSRDGLIAQLEFEKYSTEDATYAVDNCGADWNEQALKSAKNYLGFSAFSHKGLIAQLEFEKYTTDQATYGADNCGADWNEQAAKSAKAYLEYSSFSRDSLISQLEFEGFTSEQAKHGADANGY